MVLFLFVLLVAGFSFICSVSFCRNISVINKMEQVSYDVTSVFRLLHLLHSIVEHSSLLLMLHFMECILCGTSSNKLIVPDKSLS